MDLQALVDYCQGKEGASMGFPFGEIPICFRFHGKIFIEIYPNPENFKITVRCDPSVGEFFRQTYPGRVIPGYHVPLRQRRFKNTVLLDGSLEDSVVFSMIDHAYETLAR